MVFDVYTIAYFDKQFKRLAKKYPSLQLEINQLIKLLKSEPKTGFSIGNDCYKIRLAISSKGKGKSGGARIITFVTISENTIYLLSIYDKSEQENINDKELLSLLEKVK